MKWSVVVQALAALMCVGAHGGVLQEDPPGELWALLVAGSSSWYNYRHQSDVCHAYQILHKHGVPDDHIIVMMADDIANSKENPMPGQIINRPGGPDVYAGVPKDYTGATVTPANFLKILSGDEAGMTGIGSGKVVKSGPNDRIFVNLVDHGAPGIFGFPTAFLKAGDLHDTIIAMHRGKQYHEMVVYLEACEAGSMFDKLLPDDIGVYAVTAANATQNSYACYYDEGVGNFLGDVFSIKWMEDSDREALKLETLDKQFSIVKNETITSVVSLYGEVTLGKDFVAEFQGSDDAELETWGPFLPVDDPCANTSLSSTEVPLRVLSNKVATASTDDEVQYWTQQLNELQQGRAFIISTVKKLIQAVTGDVAVTSILANGHAHPISQWDCVENVTQVFNDNCFDLAANPYAMQHIQTLVNLCEHGYGAEEFCTATTYICTFQHITGVH